MDWCSRFIRRSFPIRGLDRICWQSGTIVRLPLLSFHSMTITKQQYIQHYKGRWTFTLWFHGLLRLLEKVVMSTKLAMDPLNRVPLDETTNESGSPPPSPTSATAKTGPVLRHKSNRHDLNFFLDSSESYPSPHSSIYEASLVYSSSTEELKSVEKEDRVPSHTTDNGLPSWESIVADASGNPVPLSFLRAPVTQNAHVPHELYPITEKSSLATIKASLSVKDQASASTLRPRSPGLNGKKRKSFSLSDLPLTPERKPPLLPSPLPTPSRPCLPPPERIPTPPGLPKFGQPEAINYRLPPPKTRFRDNFRLKMSPEEQEYRRQTVGLPRGVVMRGENGVMVRGKFTPIVSGHLPPQSQVHRFFRAPNSADRVESEPIERPNLARNGGDPLGSARDGGIPLNDGNEGFSRRRMAHREPFKRYVEKKQKWAETMCWFLFCCGCKCCDEENGVPSGHASAPVDRAVAQRDVLLPNSRPRLTVLAPGNNF